MTATSDRPAPQDPPGTVPASGAGAHGHDGYDAHDSHAGHAAHEMAGEALGPVDVGAWAAALVGAGIGVLVVIALGVAISA